MIHFLNTALTLILALFFFLLGILAFLLAFSPFLQSLFVSLIQNHFWAWFFLGLGFFIVGAALAAYVQLTRRKQYLRIYTGNHQITVSKTIIEGYLKAYFEKLYPNQIIPFRFLIKKRKVQIIADLPYLPPDDQKRLLESTERDLEDLLSHYIGYNQQLEIFISFDKQLSNI